MSSEQIYTLGVDVAKAHLDCHPYGATKGRRIANTSDAIASLLTELRNRKDAGASVLVVLEASGGQERALRHALHTADIPVHVANPKRVRDYARAIGWLAKTDRIDAALLARYGAQERPRPTPAPGPERTALRDLLAYRNQLKAEIQARQHQLDHFTPDGAIAHRARQALDNLKQEEKTIGTEIAAALTTPDLAKPARLLLSCPGVGKLTAATLLAHMPELGSLSDKQVASLAGLAPIARDSGTLKGRRMIQGGRAPVRNALYMAALVATTHNPTLKAFYNRLQNNSKPPKLAIAATMRKLLVTLNSLLRTNSTWKHNHQPNQKIIA